MSANDCGKTPQLRGEITTHCGICDIHVAKIGAHRKSAPHQLHAAYAHERDQNIDHFLERAMRSFDNVLRFPGNDGAFAAEGRAFLDAARWIARDPWDSTRDSEQAVFAALLCFGLRREFGEHRLPLAEYAGGAA